MIIPDLLQIVNTGVDGIPDAEYTYDPDCFRNCPNIIPTNFKYRYTTDKILRIVAYLHSKQQREEADAVAKHRSQER
ncbi:hypothetical protein TrLO_g9834 [Triparma laevis f. longispina]|uniref:Uncharacterized protein n=1 Tax=Triparma laevis f. longispina TaxID=1714387 RepID=A0A9W7KXU3_9STRA|nr:hypothetical protein TrLO_g9834 [Triparma laevis f. longispina]